MAENEKITDLPINVPDVNDEIVVEAVYISDLSIAVDPDITDIPYESGEPSKVENIGTSKKAVLKFSLREGKPGEKGDKGDPGTTDYNELINTPKIPQKTSDLINDSGFISALPGEIITEEELALALETKQDTLIAGNNIEIKDNVISSNVEIPEDLVTTPELESFLEDKQDKLIAGDNIIIENNTISSVGGASSADQVSYTNPEYPTVQAALDKLLYVAPAISNFRGGGNYEIGSTVTEVNLAWSLNKPVISQTLNQGIGSIDVSLRSYQHSGQNITTNRTYTLTVSDGTQTKSANTTISFLPKRYWGVSEKTVLEDADILALASELSTTRTQTRTFNCSGGKYFYLVIKTSYCSGIKFKVGGLAFSAVDVVTRQFTNASGHTDSYNIYRPIDIQTGSAIAVEVS